MHPHFAINPIFIAEVLSNSTKNYDRGDKFLAYRTLSTFQEYLLVDQCSDQYSLRVEHYVKQNDSQWLLTEHIAKHRGDRTVIKLASVPIEILLADLYEDVELDN